MSKVSKVRHRLYVGTTWLDDPENADTGTIDPIDPIDHNDHNDHNGNGGAM